MKYEAILRHSPIFTVERMCRALGLESSAYHQWNRRRQERETRAQEYRELTRHVRRVFEDNRRVYGYRKMWRALNDDGLALFEYKERRIMREAGLYPITTRRFIETGRDRHPDRLSFGPRDPVASKSFIRMLADNGIVGSMSKSGCPFDNAVAENFFSSAKRECIHHTDYEDFEEVKQDVFYYIELSYNRKRMHSTLGYKTPVEYRLSYLERLAG